MQFFGGTAEPKCCCIMSDNCEILRVIGHNRYLDWGNSSKVFETTGLTDLQLVRVICIHSAK